MKRLAFALAAAGAVSFATDFASADPVSVTNTDGTIWVMQIQPLGTERVPPPSEPIDMPIVEPAAVDIDPPAQPAASKLPNASKNANERETSYFPGVVEKAASKAAEVTAEKLLVEPKKSKAIKPAQTTAPATEASPSAPSPIVEDHGMIIIPRGFESRGVTTEADLTNRYRAIYNAIPFNRAEYVANPAYRHDATMELLTGQPRPTAGYTGRITQPREYTGYRPYIPSKSDYYRYRYPVGYGLRRLSTIGFGY